ncbi:hypothetical protein Tco_0371622 [Tanacetum coccineum]
MTKKSSGEHAMISYIQKQKRLNHKDFQNCLFACFLSQQKPTNIAQVLDDESRVEAMQQELLQFKIQKVWTLVDLPYGKKAISTKWVYRNKKDKRGIVPDEFNRRAHLLLGVYNQAERVWNPIISQDKCQFGHEIPTLMLSNFFVQVNLLQSKKQTTRSERVLEKPNEPPLSEGYTSGSGKGRMEHQFELTANMRRMHPNRGGVVTRYYAISHSVYGWYIYEDSYAGREKVSTDQELLEKMLNLQLEAEEESTMAFELIKFIKSMLEE